MSTRLILNGRVTLILVVFSLVNQCFIQADPRVVVSPQALNNAVALQKLTVAELGIDFDRFSEAEGIVLDSEVEHVETLQALCNKLDGLEDILKTHRSEVRKAQSKLSDLVEVDAVVAKNIARLNDAVAEIDAQLKRVEAENNTRKKNVPPTVNVSQHINIGGVVPAAPVVNSLGTAFTKLISVVQSFGPTICNLYVLSKVFNMLRDHKDAMVKMLSDMQAVIANASINTTPNMAALPTELPEMPDSSVGMVSSSWAAIVLFVITLGIQIKKSEAISQAGDGKVEVKQSPDWNYVFNCPIPKRG